MGAGALPRLGCLCRGVKLACPACPPACMLPASQPAHPQRLRCAHSAPLTPAAGSVVGQAAQQVSGIDGTTAAVTAGLGIGVPTLLGWQAAYGGYSGVLQPEEALEVLQVRGALACKHQNKWHGWVLVTCWACCSQTRHAGGACAGSGGPHAGANRFSCVHQPASVCFALNCRLRTQCWWMCGRRRRAWPTAWLSCGVELWARARQCHPCGCVLGGQGWAEMRTSSRAHFCWLACLPAACHMPSTLCMLKHQPDPQPCWSPLPSLCSCCPAWRAVCATPRPWPLRSRWVLRDAALHAATMLFCWVCSSC